MNSSSILIIVIGLIAAPLSDQGAGSLVDTAAAAGISGDTGAITISGSYYVAGAYAANPSLQERTGGPGRAPASLYDQRLRILSRFQIAEGLTLTTRFNALETIWGSAFASDDQNISFDRTYVTFRTPMGAFLVGTQDFGTFGTPILDSGSVTRESGIKYILPLGPLTLAAAFRRDTAGVGLTTTVGGAADVNADVYCLSALYRGQTREAGLLYEYLRNAVFRPLPGPVPLAPNGPYLSTLHVFLPYAKIEEGALSLETEAVYVTGNWRTYERPAVPASTPDVAAETWGLYLGAKMDLGSAYLGGLVIYGRGDDYGAEDRQEGGFAEFLAAGGDFNPCLIFLNYWYTTRIGSLTPASGGNEKTYFPDNLRMYQIYGGIRPADRLEIRASYTVADADRKPRTVKGLPLSATNREFVGDRYGTEIDLTAAYRIYDNLEYLIGAAYFFTGDYFKGDDPNAAVADNYLLIHRLTLTF